MDVIYEQPVIRAQLSIISNPPVALIDANTGLQPQFYRGASVQIDVGIFNGDEVGLRLPNLSELVLRLQTSSTSIVPLVTKIVYPNYIYSPIDFGPWQAGDAYNARFVLTAGDTDQSLSGHPSQQYWMTITGYTPGGSVIVYGAGWVTLYNPGNVIPPVSGFVSRHSQTTTTGDVAVAPTSIIHTEQITFEGAARTAEVVVSDGQYPAGSQVLIQAIFPNLTAGIVVEIYSNDTEDDPIFVFTTDAFTPNANFFMEADGAGGYVAVQQVAPAVLPA